MVLTVAMPRRRVWRHVLAPLGGDGQEQGSARRQRFGCARGARDARARPTVSARCCCDARAPTPTSSPTRALPRLTRARVLPRSSSSSTLCAKIRRTLESRPHPICPHRRTQGARTRTSRGPPTAQDPPARCVTPLALFLPPFVRARITPTPQVSIRSDTFFRQDGHRLWQTRGARATRDGARGASRVSRRGGGRRAGLRLCAKWLSAPCAARPSLSPQSPIVTAAGRLLLQRAAAAAGEREGDVRRGGARPPCRSSSHRPAARRPRRSSS